MAINQDIKCGITKKGQCYLAFIPENQFPRYQERFSYYDVSYKIIRKVINGDIKVILVFKTIELILWAKLQDNYEFTDNRKNSLPRSENILYLFDRRYSSHIIAAPRDLQYQIKSHFHESTKSFSLSYQSNLAIFILPDITLASQIDIYNYYLSVQDNGLINDCLIREIKNTVADYFDGKKDRSRQLFNVGNYGSKWIRYTGR